MAKRGKYTRAARAARLTPIVVAGQIPTISARGGGERLTQPMGAAEQMRDLARMFETMAPTLRTMANQLDRV